MRVSSADERATMNSHLQRVGRMRIGVSLVVIFACPFTSLWSEVDFEREIRPILTDNCYACHGPDENTRESGLRLDTENGAASVVIPGKSAESELIARVSTGDPDTLMPPLESKKKLTPQQVDLLTRWVDEGASWAEHWAFRTPLRPAPPEVEARDWVRNEIDAFVLGRLEAEGLLPSDSARKETLLRRVTLDLTGLPPTLEEVDAFLADESPRAYEKTVDRLLASPRYGERMVWEWLEAARYADSNGYQGDSERTMWPWRDWVIDAMNHDIPFDQFTIEQLAGDLLPNPTRNQRIATGFNRNHMINGEGGRIPEENRVEYVFDQTETFSSVWLGLTVGCARCHDHKFDPLTQREYYQLFSFFNNTPVNGGGRSGRQDPVVELKTPEEEDSLNAFDVRREQEAAALAEIEKKLFPKLIDGSAEDDASLKDLPKDIVEELKQPPGKRRLRDVRKLAVFFKERDPDYGGKLDKFGRTIEAYEKLNEAVPRVMVMEELSTPRDTFILTRGAYNKPADKIVSGLPAVLPPMPDNAPANRLGLARWLVDESHPLTSRVIVNRFWQLFFGVGLVKTSEDFGVQGEKPIYPLLLDWLATEFMRSGWNVKRMHRLIVMSATYRQSSKMTDALRERDPENRLLARGPRYRLPSFMIRDQSLALSGLSVSKLGGPPVRPYQPPGIWEEATFGKKSYKQDHGENLYRRSLYIFWRRIVGPTMFFDVSPRQVCTVRMLRTNTPLHALITLNDVTYVEAARVMAERVFTLAEKGTSESRVETAFRLATARRPTDFERSTLVSRFVKLVEAYGANENEALQLLSVGESPRQEALDPVEHAAMAALCSLILNLDEVITKE